MKQREIKFRYILKYKDKLRIVFATIEEIEMGKMDDYLMSKSALFREKDKIISRDLYTGIKDKKGKEIYEGDIMGNSLREKGEVKWEAIGFNWGDNFSIGNGDIDDIEVIGNIYENPELLTK